jgi:general secretion pathway protein L
VATWPLSGSAGTALWPQPLPEGWRLSASPSSAEAAQRRLGQTVQIRTQAERLLAAAQNGWNLRQFDLATRHRGVTWLREAWLRLRSPQWRPIRWGLAALALVQVVGLNAWAWRQQQDLRQRRDEMLSLLRSAHPQVRAVLDAPVQMRRETELLRAGAGRSGPTDLEPMLRSAAAAWPENLPVQAIRYENQQLSLAAPGLGAPQADALRQRLAPAGWQVEGSDGRITLKRRESGPK